jgi:hypothetical protein
VPITRVWSVRTSELTMHSADLEDEKVKKEYERGYKLVLDFFHEHL